MDDEKEYLTVSFTSRSIIAALKDAINLIIEIGERNIHGVAVVPVIDSARAWKITLVYKRQEWKKSL